MRQQTTIRLIATIALTLALAASAGCGAAGGSSEKRSGGAQRLPDLRIDSPMQATGQTAGVSLHFSVTNDGAATSDVAWRLVRKDAGGDVLIASGSIGTLGTGDAADRQVSDADGSDGARYEIVADPDDRIGETNEDNNLVSITAIAAPIDDPPPPPPADGELDLRFDGTHYHGMYYYTDPIFHFWVRNVSPSGIAATDVRYTVTVDGESLYSGAIAAIAANQEVEVFFHTASVGTGHHSFAVVIDPDDRIMESDEANNLYRAEVDCRLLSGPYAASSTVDLNFQDPHFHGPYGTRIVFHWFLRNHCTRTLNDPTEADDPAGHAGVDWVLRREGVTVDSGTITDPIGPGGLKEIITTVIDPGDLMEAHYTLTIDPDRRVAETTFGETNNTVSFIVILDPGSSG
jgi:hypothetical protein